MRPRVSVVIPVYNEDDTVVPILDRIFESVSLPCEVLAVFDQPEDSTVPHLEKYAETEDRLVPTLNTYGRGPARAIRFGIDAAAADVVVVTMADGSDDPQQIDDLTRLVERGVAVAAASRYMKSGQQVGGPPLKSFLSRLAGTSLYHFARVGTHDATNSFKAYSTAFVRAVGVQSEHGFEIGLELVAKARRLREPVAEIPTIWLERHAGESQFDLKAWLPHYMYWYRFAYGHKTTIHELAALTSDRFQNELPSIRPDEMRHQ